MLNVVTLGLIVPAILWRAYVLSYLWLWFVSPLGFPAVGMAQAYGLVCVAAVMHPRASREQSPEETIADLFSAFIVPTLALVVGWFIR